MFCVSNDLWFSHLSFMMATSQNKQKILSVNKQPSMSLIWIYEEWVWWVTSFQIPVKV